MVGAICEGAAPAAGQSPLENVAGLTLRGESLDVALRLLQGTAGVSLVYSPDLLPAEHVVECACADATVREALETMLDGTGLTFTASRTLIRVVRIPPGRAGHGAGTIEGRVLTDEWDTPVANAMIRVANGSGALSNASGFFVLQVPSGLHRLEVTHMGWHAVGLDIEVAAADTLRLTIRLKRQPIPLPAMIVAPGTFGILEEVSPATVRTLTREEIAAMPQLGEDVLRAVKRLPGVAAGDISTRLHIRGGTDREVLVRLDGLELYEPYHLKDWDGVLGIVDVHALGGVQLTSGGFGAEYGDKMTGVLDMTSRTSLDDATTTLGMSISNVTAMSRGGFNGDRGAWLVSARRGFLDLVLDLVEENERFSPQYYDVFGKLEYQLTPKNLLAARVLHAGDVFVYRDTPPEGVDEADIDASWGSSYGWLTWEARHAPDVTSTTILSTGRISRDRSGFIVDEEDFPQRIETEDRREFTFAGVRTDFSVGASERMLLKLGGEAKWVRADYHFDNWRRFSEVTPDTLAEPRFDSVRVDLEPSGHELSAYVAARMRPVERLTAEVGLRYDEISHTGDRGLSPRILASLEIAPGTTVKASWGRYRQSHGIHELDVGDGESEFYPAERSDQLALGIDHHFTSGIDARLELYARRLSDERPVFYNARQEIEAFPEASDDRMAIAPDRGRFHGAELLVERKSGRRWAWSASYVLAVAEDRIDGSWVPRRFDQRHTLGLHVAYQPTPRWNLSLGWRYHSGWPSSEWTWRVVPLADGSVDWRRVYGSVRTDRVSAYHRLDMRLTRKFLVGGNVLNAFIDLLNVYNRTNLASYAYDGWYSGGRLTVTRTNGQEQLPRLPTFGVRYEF